MTDNDDNNHHDDNNQNNEDEDDHDDDYDDDDDRDEVDRQRHAMNYSGPQICINDNLVIWSWCLKATTAGDKH